VDHVDPHGAEGSRLEADQLLERLAQETIQPDRRYKDPETNIEDEMNELRKDLLGRFESFGGEFSGEFSYADQCRVCEAVEPN
jgi:hypothetical protein